MLLSTILPAILIIAVIFGITNRFHKYVRLFLIIGVAIVLFTTGTVHLVLVGVYVLGGGFLLSVILR